MKALHVDSYVNAMCSEINELMGAAEVDQPPSRVGERGYAGLSQRHDTEWTLQPELDETLLTATLRPCWIALSAGHSALRELVRAANDHPMEFPDADPGFTVDELNPRTRPWQD